MEKMNDFLFPGTIFNPKIFYGRLKALYKRIKRDVFKLQEPIDNTSVNIICHDYKLIVVGIPKVATTSMVKELVYNKKLGNNTEMISCRFLDLVKTNGKFHDYYKTAFVRNPWAKTVSVYKSKVCAKNKLFVSPLYLKYKKLKHNMPFNEFIFWLCNEEEGADLFADRHWISQHTFFEDNDGQCLVDKIVYYEEFTKEWEAICEKINAPLVEFNNYSLKTAKDPKEYRTFYDEETKEMIQKRYEKDIQLLKYEF